MGGTTQQAAAPPAIKVPMIAAKGHTVPICRSFPGTTQALRAATLQARVTGDLGRLQADTSGRNS